MIPILDLVGQYHELKEEIDRAIFGVLESGHFISGPNVQAFEREIARYLGVADAIALNSGTDALQLGLRVLDIGPGDEVITSPFTFVATSEAIGSVGATPVFVDIDPVTFNIEPKRIRDAITARTKAILPIHLYGAPANLFEIRSIAIEYGLPIVEDCAQAIGAAVNGVKVGTSSEVGCFSFFPSKNLGACGDGGLVTTSDARLADRLRSLRAHGGRVKYYHDELGVNSRLDEIQAAILRVKLPHLDSWIAARRAIAARYTALLRDLELVTTPSELAGSLHVFHQYTIRVRNRDAVKRQLADAGIQTMIYYPLPLHLQRVHKDGGWSVGSFPHSETAAQEVLSLPMYPELTPSIQDRVVAGLELALNSVTTPA
jgi:dTDP-4-amino-4,6-dideoxygalactose transaminase